MPKLFSILLLTLLSCVSVLIPHLLFRFSSSLPLLDSFGARNQHADADLDVILPLCSSMPNGTICCDRRHFHSDVCVMKGDVRTRSASSTVFVYSKKGSGMISNIVASISNGEHEKIKPYARKWERVVTDTIDELDLVSVTPTVGIDHHCNVVHDVPALFFSTGGYLGNLYHEFFDGILPLYITSRHLNKQVVFAILQYQSWWIMKYRDVLSQLSDYPPIDFGRDNRTHCFTKAIADLRYQDYPRIDFREVLERAYWPRIRGMIQEEKHEAQERLKYRNHLSSEPRRPKLVILSRNGSRAIRNQDELVKVGEEIGFEVVVLRPGRATELARMYRAMNSSDVMLGVHGAASMHFLFLKPGSVFIQVIPLGTDGAAEACFGEPARKLGLKYVGYKIHPEESSLYGEYDKDDPVLVNPESVNEKGWNFTKKIYLDVQRVRLDLSRFRRRLVQAYGYSMRTIINPLA